MLLCNFLSLLLTSFHIDSFSALACRFRALGNLEYFWIHLLYLLELSCGYFGESTRPQDWLQISFDEFMLIDQLLGYYELCYWYSLISSIFISTFFILRTTSNSLNSHNYGFLRWFWLIYVHFIWNHWTSFSNYWFKSHWSAP